MNKELIADKMLFDYPQVNMANFIYDGDKSTFYKEPPEYCMSHWGKNITPLEKVTQIG